MVYKFLVSRLQLETIHNTIQNFINAHNKKDEELKKKELEQKEKIASKKTKKKPKYEDHVDDEYDDFDEKFHA